MKPLSGWIVVAGISSLLILLAIINLGQKTGSNEFYVDSSGLYRAERGLWLVGQSGAFGGGLESWVMLESVKYGVDYGKLAKTISCESNFSPTAMAIRAKLIMLLNST